MIGAGCTISNTANRHVVRYLGIDDVRRMVRPENGLFATVREHVILYTVEER